jgi:hypothetical protein
MQPAWGRDDVSQGMEDFDHNERSPKGRAPCHAAPWGGSPLGALGNRPEAISLDGEAAETQISAPVMPCPKGAQSL